MSDVRKISKGVTVGVALVSFSFLYLFYAVTITPMALFFWVLTLLFPLLLFSKKSFHLTLSSLLIIALASILGSLFAFFNFQDFSQHGVPFLASDQIYFYETAKHLAKSQTIPEIFSVSFYSFNAYHIIHSFFALFAFIDFHLTGDMHLFTLLLSVVWIFSLIALFFFRLALNFFDSDKALKVSLVFSLLFPLLPYSGLLLRDLHVTLLTVIVLNWLFEPFKYRRMALMVLFVYLLSGVRLANSFMMIALLLIYVLFSSKKVVARTLSLALVLFITISSATFLVNSYMSTASKLEGYDIRTSYTLQTSGFSTKLYALPPVLKEFAVINFVLSAFPVNTEIRQAETPYQTAMGAYFLVTRSAWFVVFIGFYFFGRETIRFFRLKTSRLHFALALFFLLFAAASMSDPQIRRFFPVLPLVYLPVALAYEGASIKRRRVYLISSALLLVALSSVYFFIS